MKTNTIPLEEFQATIHDMDVGEQTKAIARGVLVDGKPQALFAKQFNLSRGAVSQAVARVRQHHQARHLPAGFTVVHAVLPAHQAFIVRQWERQAKERQQEPK